MLFTLIFLKSFKITFSAFVPFPRRREVRAALATTEWNWLYAILFVFIEDLADALLEPEQADELCVGRVRDEVHLWWRWFGWWDLKMNLVRKRPQ